MNGCVTFAARCGANAADNGLFVSEEGCLEFRLSDAAFVERVNQLVQLLNLLRACVRMRLCAFV
jgi:hypothetical protein